MALLSNALTTVDDLLSYMGESLPTTEMLTVYHDESDSATAATVAISGSPPNLALTITGGANAGTVIVATASGMTMAELRVAVDALNKGWVTTVIGGAGGADSTGLDALATVSAFGMAAVQYLTGTNTHRHEEAINAASVKIETHCNRTFAATNYTHMYSGRSSKKLPVRQYPIIQVNRIAIGRTDAFTINNTSTDAVQANAALESAQLRLDVVGGANASSSTVVYTSSTTLTTLVASINSEGNGWEAEVLSTAEGSWLVADCLDFESRNALNSSLTVWMPLQAQDRYEVHKDAGIVYRTGGNLTGSPQFWPMNAAWQLGTRPIELRPLTADEAGPFWPEGVFNIYVSYRAGFETTPADVKQQCEELAKNYLRNASRNTALTSESIEGYSFSSGFSGPAGRSGAEGAFTQAIRGALSGRVNYMPQEFIEV